MAFFVASRATASGRQAQSFNRVSSAYLPRSSPTVAVSYEASHCNEAPRLWLASVQMFALPLRICPPSHSLLTVRARHSGTASPFAICGVPSPP